MKYYKKILLTIIFSLYSSVTYSGETLDKVKKQGYVHCGVSQGKPGFSFTDKGQWKGMDVDMCRAVASAVFGDASKVKYRPLNAKERFTALQTGEIDLLARNTTWTVGRDTALGCDFVGVNYYDGQGFMVPKALNIKTAKELAGATICVIAGTTTELNVADYFRSQGMEYEIVTFATDDETVAAYDSGRCDAFTTDRSALAGHRWRLKNPDDHVVLEDVISKEPLGPMVRQGDSQWADIVRWSLNVMILAEELRITSGNVDEMKQKSSNPEVKRLLGLEGDFSRGLDLSQDWAYNVIKHVGNYSESFDRNLGAETNIALARGQNALWSNGGLLFSPPFR